MKQFFAATFLCVLVICITGCADAGAYEETPDSKGLEELSGAIVAAISSNDTAAFEKLLISQHEMVICFQISSEARTEAKANDSIYQWNRQVDRSKASFMETRAAGNRDGLTWNQSKYKRCSFETDSSKGLSMTVLTIYMDCKGTEYPLTIRNVVRTASGWKIFGKIYYGIYDPEAHARRLMDSIVAADSTAAAEDAKRSGGK